MKKQQFKKSVKERPTENNSKPTIGRKLSRVLSIFRKQHQKAEEEAGGGRGEPIKEPIYEELIYGDISSPQNCLNTYGSVNYSKQIKNSELIEILRLGKPFPQVNNDTKLPNTFVLMHEAQTVNRNVYSMVLTIWSKLSTDSQ